MEQLIVGREMSAIPSTRTVTTWERGSWKINNWLAGWSKWAFSAAAAKEGTKATLVR